MSSWEFVTLRKGADILPRELGRKIKVTARYQVQISPRKLIQCVRVRIHSGLVLHFSKTEFDRLFEPDPEE